MGAAQCKFLGLTYKPRHSQLFKLLMTDDDLVLKYVWPDQLEQLQLQQLNTLFQRVGQW